MSTLIIHTLNVSILVLNKGFSLKIRNMKLKTQNKVSYFLFKGFSIES